MRILVWWKSMAGSIYISSGDKWLSTGLQKILLSLIQFQLWGPWFRVRLWEEWEVTSVDSLHIATLELRLLAPHSYSCYLQRFSQFHWDVTVSLSSETILRVLRIIKLSGFVFFFARRFHKASFLEFRGGSSTHNMGHGGTCISNSTLETVAWNFCMIF